MDGLCWRVGTGTSISIFNDSWIIGLPNCPLPDYLITCPVLNSNLSLVSDLIDSNTRKWREEVILNTLDTVDAKRILRIPLAEEDRPDLVAL